MYHSGTFLNLIKPKIHPLTHYSIMKNFLSFSATIFFVCLSFLGKADLPYKNLKMGTPMYSNTTNTSGAVTSITFTIPVEISMTDIARFIPQVLNNKWESAFSFAFQNASDPYKDIVPQEVTTALSTDATPYLDSYVLNAWTTFHFTLKITLNTSPTTAYYRVHLKSMNLFGSSPINNSGSGVSYQFDETTDFQLINAKSTTGIETTTEKNFQFYPNPVVSELRIETSLNVSEVRILDLSGKVIFVGKEKEINVDYLPKGIYSIQIKNEGAILTKRFVKQ